MPRNLILSVSHGYYYYDVSRFIESLKKVGYSGHVCLFVGLSTKAHTIRQLRAAGIEIITFRDTFPFIDQPHPANFQNLPNPIHIWNFRHFMYYNYLLEHEGEFDNVLLSDSRDVAFQRDPFSFDLGGMLNVAIEDRNTPLRSTPSNAEWIMKGYGQEVLEEIGDFPVSCAGTTLGPAPIIKAYLHTLLTEICSVRDAMNCADQAIHNVLLNRGQLGQVQRLYNDNGPVLTIGTLAQNTSFKLDSEGYILNEVGERAHILHQYDRHPELNKVVDKLAYTSALRRKYLYVRDLVYLRNKYRKFKQGRG
ncbi:MAG: hypothetical protein EOO61_10300 [Hymenobacter sp.]|nr:MAG: hypothetical protein EOO61_10300 [Hymenobacter sp.]